MTAYKGYYSLIQFCPDPSRAEVANVGVLLFCPELNFISAHVSSGNDRVRRFFGSENADAKRLKAAKLGIKDRLETERSRFRSLEDLEKFIRTRANELVITEPRSMKVRDPQKQLGELFEELVGGRAREARESATEFPELHKIFGKPSIASRIHRDMEVTVPIVNRMLEIPYGYQNGVMNLVKPQRLHAGSVGLDRAMTLALEGELLQRLPDEEGNERKLIVCLFADDSNRGRETEQQAKDILGYKQVRALTPSGLFEFGLEVEAQAH